jgi:hypothetical protein
MAECKTADSFESTIHKMEELPQAWLVSSAKRVFALRDEYFYLLQRLL